MPEIELVPLKSPVTVAVQVPGSKSYTNRALLIAALTKGSVQLNNPLYCEDTLAMIGCLKDLGLQLECFTDKILIHDDLSVVQEGYYELFAKDSGTTCRFLLPLLCLVPGVKSLYGNPRLSERPIHDLVTALNAIGAQIEYGKQRSQLPLRVLFSSLFQGSEVLLQSSMSSQFLSALLMISPLLQGLKIRLEGSLISKPYIEMTLSAMRDFGVEVISLSEREYYTPPGQIYQKKEYCIEGDYSSAGYLFALAALTKSTITVKNLKKDSRQADKKFLEVLAGMGNPVTFGDHEVTISGKQILPVDINMEAFPDQVPTIAVLAAFANGVTNISGVRSLRVKESDRIMSLKLGLKRMGIEAFDDEDRLTIYGGRPKPATIDSYGDHRIAMAFAVAGMKLPGMKIMEPDVVNKTFPGFWEVLNFKHLLK